MAGEENERMLAVIELCSMPFIVMQWESKAVGQPVERLGRWIILEVGRRDWIQK